MPYPCPHEQFPRTGRKAPPLSNLPVPVKELVSLIRRHKLTYATFAKYSHMARVHLGMKETTRGRKLPRLLSETQLSAFYAAIDKSDDLKHQIMLRLLFYTGVRVSELTGMRMADVDLPAGKIFINQGKGSKDRYVIFPQGFGLTLKSYMATAPENEYLFESRQRRRYSERRIGQLIDDYAEAAGLAGVHPHLLRHQALTHLTKAGLSDSQIQLISGHASKKSLERYQHLALGDVSPAYNEAMKKVEL
jgi:integrase/recombinase XerD